MNDAERLDLISAMNRHIGALRRSGIDEMALFVAMADQMPDFKRLMDASASGEIETLARRFPDFHHYAALLTSIAGAIGSGAIKVPPASSR
jgi:hypothetical protein